MTQANKQSGAGSAAQQRQSGPGGGAQSNGSSDVAKLINFYGWVLDINLPLETQVFVSVTYQAILANQPQRAAELSLLQQQIEFIDRVMQLDRDSAIMWKQANQAGIVAWLRASPDMLSQQLVALYDAAHAQLTTGSMSTESQWQSQPTAVAGPERSPQPEDESGRAIKELNDQIKANWILQHNLWGY